MFRLIHLRKSFTVICCLTLAAFLFIKCINNEQPATIATKEIRFNQYTGSLACAKCHQNIYDSHIQTAHYLTSQKATEKNIKGSVDAAKNKFIYNPRMYVAVEKRNNIFFQVEYIDGIKKFARPFNITVGSGKRGQTFLHWNENKLFQLPLTYFTPLDQWTNSPGFSNRVVFNRPITSRL